jgi:signal transduction histidine kinase
LKIRLFTVLKLFAAFLLNIFSLSFLVAQTPLEVNIETSTNPQIIDYQLVKIDSLSSSSTICLRFALRNRLKIASQNFYLFVNQENTKQLYRDKPRQLISLAGLYVPLKNMPVSFQPFYLDIPLTAQYEQVFYLYIANPDLAKKIQLKLIPKKIIELQNQQKLREDYFLMGILLVMVFYNLILFSLVLDRSYLYYVIYIGMLGIWIFYEYLYQYTNFSLLFVISIVNTWWVIFFNLGYLGFVRHFLKAETDFPVWHKWIKFLEKLLVVPFIFILYDIFQLSNYPTTETYFEIDAMLMAALALVNVGVCLSFGLYAWWQGSRLATLFLVASVPLLMSGVYFGLEYLIVQPFMVNELYSYSLLRQMVVLEIVLLAVALAYRYNLLKKEIAQKDLEHLHQIEKTIHLKTQTDNLESLNQAKDKLFSIIGHDLRSPINSLQGALYLLNNETINQEQFLEISKKLQKNVESLQFTFDNLFQWAYSQMGGIKTHIERINLNQIIQQNIAFLQGNANYKNIQIRNEIPDELWAKADADQISLVVRNLINNAIKFTPTNGHITLKAQQNSGSVDVSITDTGVGMSPDLVAQVFNRHTITTSRGTAGEKGTGLGLLLCKEMIENNHGIIWVNSAENQGSTFTFRLPANR